MDGWSRQTSTKLDGWLIIIIIIIIIIIMINIKRFILSRVKR